MKLEITLPPGAKAKPKLDAEGNLESFTSEVFFITRQSAGLGMSGKSTAADGRTLQSFDMRLSSREGKPMLSRAKAKSAVPYADQPAAKKSLPNATK